MPDRPHDFGSLMRPTGDPDLLTRVARSERRQPSTSPTPEVVEVVADLGALARLIVEHNRRVMAGEPYDWAALADAFAEATCVCRRQVVIELGDAGSG